LPQGGLGLPSVHWTGVQPDAGDSIFDEVKKKDRKKAELVPSNK